MRIRTLMNAFAAMLTVLWLNATPASAEGFIIEPLDYDFPSEVADAAAQGKNVVIMFHQNGCPYCDKMRKRVYPDPAVGALYGEKFHLIEVNNKGDLEVTTHDGEAMAEKDYAEKMHVRATPVFLFLAKDGTEALKLTGYQDAAMFNAAGRYVSSDAFKDGTSFINFVRAGR